MSLPAATRAAANTLGKKLPPTKALRSPPPLLTFKYERHPSPLNSTNFVSTREFAYDKTHPLHTRTARRLAAFDPRLLHWNVRVPVELSKRATVRGWVVSRVKVAFREALREGLGRDGRSAVGEQGLSGALCIFVGKDRAVLEAGGGCEEGVCAAFAEGREFAEAGWSIAAEWIGKEEVGVQAHWV